MIQPLPLIGFDTAMRDPQDPDQLFPADNCGDHPHPSRAGYKALAGAISLSLFTH